MKAHNSYRCQNCDGMGKLVDVETSRSDHKHDGRPDGPVGKKRSADWKRVTDRVIECRDCGERWCSR